MSILEGRAELSRLVKAAAAGQESVIASKGTPMASLIGVEARPRLRRFGSVSLSMTESRDLDAAFTHEIDEPIARSLS